MFTELLWALERLAALRASINESHWMIQAWAIINGNRIGVMFPNEMLLQLLY